MYSNGVITVDERFVRFGSKSFAINKITSVDVRSTVTTGSRGYRSWWVLAAIVAIVLVVGGLTQKSGAGQPVLLILAAIFAALGWRSWNRREDIVSHELFLVTAAGEAPAFQTSDGNEIGDLREAIEEAMARSG